MFLEEEDYISANPFMDIEEAKAMKRIYKPKRD